MSPFPASSLAGESSTTITWSSSALTEGLDRDLLLRPPFLAGSESAVETCSPAGEEEERCFLATFTVTSPSSSALFLFPPTGSGWFVTLVPASGFRDKSVKEEKICGYWYCDLIHRSRFPLFSQRGWPEAELCGCWSACLFRKRVLNIWTGNRGLAVLTSSMRSWRTLSGISGFRPEPFKGEGQLKWSHQ